MKKRIVMAYSGGLDTSVMAWWLREKYDSEVIAAIVDVGQKEDFAGIKKRALRSGASRAYLIDAKAEFAKDYIFPALKANAAYESRYLLGTAIARPIIAEKVIEVARKEKAFAVSHGATGKGNDQIRFELTFRALMPAVRIIAPWREWDLVSREDEIAYAEQHNLALPPSKNKLYSVDANLWHTSHEGQTLEDPAFEPPEDVYQMTASPAKAPSKPEYVRISFTKGEPTGVNGKACGPVQLIELLNRIGGRNGVGRVDMVENRVVGMKARNVYECPGATLLYAAHRELESLTLDRETMHYKEVIGPKYGEMVYYGLWHTSLRRSLDAFINETQRYVTGEVTLKLLKGSLTVAGRKSPYSLYWDQVSTFGASDEFKYDHHDAAGFIKLFGLPLEVEALLRNKKR